MIFLIKSIIHSELLFDFFKFLLIVHKNSSHPHLERKLSMLFFKKQNIKLLEIQSFCFFKQKMPSYVNEKKSEIGNTRFNRSMISTNAIKC